MTDALSLHGAAPGDAPAPEVPPASTIPESITPDPSAEPSLLRILAQVRARPIRIDGDDDRPYRDFLNALAVAVYTTDADGRITFFNEAAAQFWGRRPELGELWCGSLRLYFPGGAPMRHDECPMAVALRERRPVHGKEAIAERPDGSHVAFVAYPAPLWDDDGSLTGAINVLVDVTERIRAEEGLRRTAELLQVSNAVKDEFLGLVSHELRTPVTTIFGNARLLLERGVALSPERRDAMVGDIAADSERLMAIIENLLLLTRLEAGVEAELEPQVLTHVVRKSVASFQRRHAGRRLSVTAPIGPVIVEADRTYLELLVENLLSNADKYSPPSEAIEVRVGVERGEVSIVVLDRGIGFSEEEGLTLFAPFFRAENARKHASGVGIGLALCRRVVELQGGRIWARPRRDGGAEVGFVLPLAADAGEVA